MNLPSYIDEGAGDAVVFLHGVGSGKEGFLRQKQSIVEAGYRFIAIDAPGFGQTAAALSEKTFDGHVNCTLAVLDQLKVEQAVFIGHSLGGMTVQEIFANFPHRVRAMVLSATSPAFGKSGGDFQENFVRSRLKPFEEGMTMPEFAQRSAGKLVGPAPEPHALDEIVEVMSGVSIASYISAIKTITTFDRRANLANIDVPTLLIAGSHDANSPAAMMEKMATKIPNAKIVVLNDTGHMAPIENSATFNHHVLKFMGALPQC